MTETIKDKKIELILFWLPLFLIVSCSINSLVFYLSWVADNLASGRSSGFDGAIWHEGSPRLENVIWLLYPNFSLLVFWLSATKNFTARLSSALAAIAILGVTIFLEWPEVADDQHGDDTILFIGLLRFTVVYSLIFGSYFIRLASDLEHSKKVWAYFVPILPLVIIMLIIPPVNFTLPFMLVGTFIYVVGFYVIRFLRNAALKRFRSCSGFTGSD